MNIGHHITLSFVLCFSFGQAQQRSPECVNPPSDLISWYDGELNTNDIQSAFNGQPGPGLSYGQGVVGYAFYCNGIDGYVVKNNATAQNIVGPVTIDLWAKKMANGGTQTLISKGAGYIPQDEPSAYILRFVNDEFQAVFEPTNTGNNIVLSGPLITDTNWHFYAYVRNSFSHSLIIDSNVVATSSFGPPPASALNLPLTIGTQRHNPQNVGQVYANHFTGYIDEVEIFNRALQLNELMDIYFAGSSGKCKDNTGVRPQSTPSISIFPNPSNGEVNILNEWEEDLSIELLDFRGRTVLRKQIGLGMESLVLPNFLGTYSIKIIGSNQVLMKKIVKY